MKDSPKENGFYIKRRFFFLGRWLKHGGLYTKVLRFFKKARALWLIKCFKAFKNKYDIAIIRSNPIEYDVRVQKIIKALSKKRYEIAVLGWDRENEFRKSEKVYLNVFIRRLKLRAPYGHVLLIMYMPIFWLWSTINLILIKPKMIHACDLDCLISSIIYKYFFNKKTKIIFDNFERYALAFIKPKNVLSKTLFRVVYLLENILALKSDALIVVSKKRLLTFKNFMPKYTTVIMNTPEDMLNRILVSKRMRIRKNSGEFLIVYAGSISKSNGILLLIDAIKEIENAKLILMGRNFDIPLNALIKKPRIHYLSLVPHITALTMVSQADVVPILYDPEILISQYANPNKLFEAMMLKKPVITNVCEDIVKEKKCGIIVNYSMESIKNALLFLKKHPSLAKKMGNNGRKAYEEKFNWKVMEKRLYEVYDALLSPSL